jgi:hypothetical protein
MREDTWKRLDAHLAELPDTCAGPALDEEIKAASARLRIPFPPDYRDFLRRYGAAHVGSWPIFGVRPAASLGKVWSVVDVNEGYRAQRYPGIIDWLIISEDGAGNPYGIAPDGQVWVSDHDFAQIEPMARDFEDFLLRVCLEPEDGELPLRPRRKGKGRLIRVPTPRRGRRPPDQAT